MLALRYGWHIGIGKQRELELQYKRSGKGKCMELTQQGNIIRRRFQLYLGILTRQAMKEQSKCRSRQLIAQSSRARYNVILGPSDLVVWVALMDHRPDRPIARGNKGPRFGP